VTPGGGDGGWVVTCDPGVDDAVALAVATGHPGCRVRAVVAGAGNVDAPTAWRNAVGLAALFGLDVPVAMGSSASVDGAPIARAGAPHGADGLAGLHPRLPDRPAAPGRRPSHSTPPPDGAPLVEGHVVALGPLTDASVALREGRAVDHVVWMGGTAVTAAGTTDPAAEFNAAADPRAVDEVLASPLVAHVVPLEVTGRVRLPAADLDRWRAGPPAARLCAELAASRPGATGAVLHDPVALVAALEPGLFTWRGRRLRCARGGDHSAGALVSAPRGPGGDARVAVDVDVRAVRERIVGAVLALGA
jgi:inosine-uridine nucleoside N-ribohydrolase